MRYPPVVAVVGADHADEKTLSLAEGVGREIAKAGCWLICGGRGGVMEAASRGARKTGGMTIGILPGTNRNDANPHIELPIITDMGEGRNLLIVRNADAVIAVGGEWGTLSEIALARKIAKPVIGLRTWSLRKPDNSAADITEVETPEEAINVVMTAIARR